MDDDRDKYPSELAERFQVRLPPGLRDQIRTAADKNGRSMNAEIVARLTSAASPDGEVQKLRAELDAERAVTAALQHNLDVFAEQLAGPVGENRKEVLRVLSALRIRGRMTPE